jgi:hypothetical protein
MAEISDYYPGDLADALDRAMTWMISRLNANVSLFAGNAVATPTNPAFIEGSLAITSGSINSLAQDTVPCIVLNPLSGVPADDQAGPDGFPINYSPTPLLSGNLFVNVLPLVSSSAVSGRVMNLPSAASDFRVDVYSRTDVFYYGGSAPIAADGTWNVPSAAAGTAIAFLMPAASQPPAQGSFTSSVSGWVAHSNTGAGPKLRDYFVRIYSQTDIEYLQEDNVPIIVQDSTHGRFGSSLVTGAGTPTAHVIYNDPQLGPVDLYSTLQNLAVYSDLPRSIEVPPGDPDYAGPGTVTSSNVAYIQNRCWIYDAALIIIVLSVAGLWEAAQRIVSRLNDLRDDPAYLPSTILEDAEDGTTARWSLTSGSGTAANVFDATAPSGSSGSNVIAFTATTAPASWNFTGANLPDSLDSIVQWRYKTGVDFSFALGVTSSSGKVTTIRLSSTGPAGYDAPSKTVTSVFELLPDAWRVATLDLSELISDAVAGDTLISIKSFQITLASTGTLSLDDFSVGAPQPAGSLSFSYDVYNGQVDLAYIRSGALAWVCYAYGICMERTGDFQHAALGLQSMLNFLFSIQSTAADARQNLIMLGWGKYVDPGYRYVPGQITSTSTEHNIDCYFAFDKASRVLPTAAQNLFDQGLITGDQFTSLRSTATTAGIKAAQVRDALLNQLWIPASGSVKGHFAQGASSSGLDTSLALDVSGTWAAMFCHEVGDDSKAVESLEFIYENFFLTNQQILESSNTDWYNETYEQLTPFDGFKPYADSTGGYSGSPPSVWMEGTWGGLAAYLRLSDNASLQSYFASNYAGGWEGFLARLVESMKIVASTTGDGVLAYSVGARALPWEFTVRKTIAATAWFWITATRNDVMFTNTSAALLGRPFLKVPQGVEQSVQQLAGQSSIGALDLEVTDGGGYMTALAAGGKLEGRKVSLRVGYPGMVSPDFVTLATQEIESIQTLDGLTGYKLQCKDLKRTAKEQIFARGDNGSPISDQNPRTIRANPMDALLMVLQNELGMGQSPSLPETAWRLYDPGLWDATGTLNPSLIAPNPLVDTDQILFYRNGIFAGYLLEFTLTGPVEAKQFLEYEIFHALGGYLIVLSDGKLSPRFFLPPYSFPGLFSFNDRNMTVLPSIQRQPLINQVTYRLDYDGSNFQTELLFADATSLQQFGLAGQDIIESKGLRSVRGGISLAGLTATRIFRRYAGINPVTLAAYGGAPTLGISSQFMTLTVEAGDYVFASHPLLPNFETGRRGVFNRIYEVIEKQPNYSQGSMTYSLLDTGWASAKKLSRVAPDGTAAFADASSGDRARYIFICNSLTGAYSDGPAGKTIF